MAKKTNENFDATKMSDEQLKKAHEKFRKDMREKFDKWITVYDEEATSDDVNKYKKDFDDEVAKYANQTYTIVDKNALAYAELLKKWNAEINHWEKGTWKGMIMFDKVISELIEKYKKDETLPFEVDYATLMYLYQTMSNPAGSGLESARMMAELENYDPFTGEQKEGENFITYSHILQNILDIIRNLINIDKKLKIMRERINIATAGIKIDFKITEIEEFIEFHDALFNEALPDEEQLAKI
jgi:hypothetical protein